MASQVFLVLSRCYTILLYLRSDNQLYILFFLSHEKSTNLFILAVNLNDIRLFPIILKLIVVIVFVWLPSFAWFTLHCFLLSLLTMRNIIILSFFQGLNWGNILYYCCQLLHLHYMLKTISLGWTVKFISFMLVIQRLSHVFVKLHLESRELWETAF